MKTLTVCCLALAFTAAPALSDQDGLTIGGMQVSDGATFCFENELTSTMELVLIEPDTQPGVWQLGGQYVNNATGTDCQGTSFPLQGVLYPGEPSTTLSFSVAWSNAEQSCDASASWTGYIKNMSNGAATLVTRWVLALPSDNGENFQTGSDVFTLKQASVCQAP